jgi:hypothetical protein
VPPAAVAVILCLQPADHLGERPDAAPWLERSVYDDFDVAAMALRGLNAARGRVAGRTDAPPELGGEDFDAALDGPQPPLAPRYYLEYPHGALFLFRLGWAAVPDVGAFPAAMCDGDYHDIVYHTPRGEQERRWWAEFRRATQVYLVLMAACGLGLTAVLRAGYERGGGLSSSGLLLLLPAALYFTLNRFDVLPALLTALSLACLGRGRAAAAGALLAAAAMIKVYPVLLVPVVLRYLSHEPRRAAAWAAGFAAVAAAFVLPPLLGEGWEAVSAPYRIQLGREPLLQSLTAYGAILPADWAHKDDPVGPWVRVGAVVAVVVAACWRRPPDLAAVLRRGAVVLIVFIGLSVFFSPQWVVWLAPLLLPLARRDWLLAGLVVALDLVTYFTWPVWAPWPDAAVAVYARFAVLAGIVAWLLWAGRRARAPGAKVFTLLKER